MFMGDVVNGFVHLSLKILGQGKQIQKHLELGVVLEEELTVG
jgi:hypothetical protein